MTTGHVFHPGHDELHGITVIAFTGGPRTFVGRWDAIENGMVIMNAASMHEEGKDAKSREQWLADTKTYGVAVHFPRITIPHKDVTRVVRLGDWESTA